LNWYAGVSLETVKKRAAFPAPLWLAVIRYAAYEIYSRNALGLLDNYTCNSAMVTQNLEDDNMLAATAVVDSPSGKLTGTCRWWPKDAAGQVISDYKAAALGAIQSTDYQGNLSTYDTRVIGYPDYDKALERVDSPPQPSDDGGGPAQYDDDEVEA
jgi:hypothetical protein